jgi:hypothetical protein
MPRKHRDMHVPGDPAATNDSDSQHNVV